jgi:ATP-dependent RNA helicase UAP56/SUB2
MTKDTAPLSALILCNTRELAYQIKKEFSRLGKYLNFRTSVYFGGVPEEENRMDIKKNNPHIVVGTPGRILSLVRGGAMKLDKLRYFVIDECDNVLAENSMRTDV